MKIILKFYDSVIEVGKEILIKLEYFQSSNRFDKDTKEFSFIPEGFSYISFNYILSMLEDTDTYQFTDKHDHVIDYFGVPIELNLNKQFKAKYEEDRKLWKGYNSNIPLIFDRDTEYVSKNCNVKHFMDEFDKCNCMYFEGIKMTPKQSKLLYNLDYFNPHLMMNPATRKVVYHYRNFKGKICEDCIYKYILNSDNEEEFDCDNKLSEDEFYKSQAHIHENNEDYSILNKMVENWIKIINEKFKDEPNFQFILNEAVKAQDINYVKFLLKQPEIIEHMNDQLYKNWMVGEDEGRLISILNWDESYVILTASNLPNDEIFELLLDNGADPNLIGNNRECSIGTGGSDYAGYEMEDHILNIPLFITAKNKNLKRFKKLCEKNVNFAVNNGWNEHVGEIVRNTKNKDLINYYNKVKKTQLYDLKINKKLSTSWYNEKISSDED